MYVRIYVCIGFRDAPSLILKNYMDKTMMEHDMDTVIL